jgi:hypothetical protein
MGADVAAANPDIGEQLREYAQLRGEPGSDELSLLEAAMFLEETFEILLSDAEIAPGTLGTFALMEQLIAEKRGGV